MLYTYKGETYKLLRHVLIKCPNTGEWETGVLYERISMPGMHYVRHFNDFHNKFEIAKEE